MMTTTSRLTLHQSACPTYLSRCCIHAHIIIQIVIIHVGSRFSFPLCWYMYIICCFITRRFLWWLFLWHIVSGILSSVRHFHILIEVCRFFFWFRLGFWFWLRFRLIEAKTLVTTTKFTVKMIPNKQQNQRPGDYSVLCGNRDLSVITLYQVPSNFYMQLESTRWKNCCIILTLLRSSFSFYWPLTIKKEEVYNCKQLFIYFWSGIFTFNNRKMHTFDVNFGLSQSSQRPYKCTRRQSGHMIMIISVLLTYM